MLRPVITDAPDAAHLKPLLARVRLLGSADVSEASDLLRRGWENGGVPDAAAQAELHLWQAWADAWPLHPFFRPGSAISGFHRAVGTAESAYRPSTICWAYLGAAFVYHTMRLPGLSSEMLAAATATSWTAVDREAAAWHIGLTILNAFLDGDVPSAEIALPRLQELTHALALPLYSARAATIRARIALEKDQPEIALEDAEEALALLEEAMVDSCPARLDAWLIRHDVAWWQGDRESASNILDRIPARCLDLTGARQRIERRREALRTPAHVHYLPRRVPISRLGETTSLTTPVSFWVRIPDLSRALGRHPILIAGERGTGKIHLARRLHDVFVGRDASFTVIDCDAADVGEPTLTALNNRHVASPAETVVFRNVDRLPRRASERLERILESMGARDGVDPLNGICIFATASKPLDACVAEGGFPDALFQTIGTIVFELQPLRRTPERIETIARVLMEEMSQHGAASPGITERALAAMCRYSWPGNVRQLRNEIHRAMTLVGSEPAPVIDVGDLSTEVVAGTSKVEVATSALEEVLAATERDVIAAVLERHSGQVSSAADELGLTRQGLYKKIKRLGIDVSRAQRTDLVSDEH